MNKVQDGDIILWWSKGRGKLKRNCKDCGTAIGVFDRRAVVMEAVTKYGLPGYGVKNLGTVCEPCGSKPFRKLHKHHGDVPWEE